MFYERLQSLAKETNKSFNQIERELGYPRNALNAYKSGKSPSAKRTAELAKYFGVSTNYLIGNDENKVSNNLTNKENDLVAAFRMESEDMSEEEQAEFNEALKDMMKLAKKLLHDDSNWKK
ncbi:helix-turn-helix domain-containing protein [Lactococcus formosensis subsp. bovis]|uniref:helix-turn-helix domain-containing protein n=1 Tax=Lactococcus formosensis TaxID=1281486 RepID=UPI001BCDD952|nr:helix-turn-helix transcriptional regulator [Lactococcus formosensis]